MIKEFELPKSIESPFTGIVLKLIEPEEEEDSLLSIYLEDDESGPEYTDGHVKLYQSKSGDERLYVTYELNSLEVRTSHNPLNEITHL